MFIKDDLQQRAGHFFHVMRKCTRRVEPSECGSIISIQPYLGAADTPSPKKYRIITEGEGPAEADGGLFVWVWSVSSGRRGAPGRAAERRGAEFRWGPVRTDGPSFFGKLVHQESWSFWSFWSIQGTAMVRRRSMEPAMEKAPAQRCATWRQEEWMALLFREILKGKRATKRDATQRLASAFDIPETTLIKKLTRASRRIEKKTRRQL